MMEPVSHPLIASQVVDAIRDFDYEVSLDGSRLRFGWPGLPLSLHVDAITESNYFAALHCRTTSWEFAGDRSDLHDIISYFAAAHLRSVNRRSSRLVDVPHPAMPPSAEVYARYIVPEQPMPVISLGDSGRKELGSLLFGLAHINHLVYHAFLEGICSETASWNVDAGRDFAEVVASALNIDLEREDVVFSVRSGPDLVHFRSRRLRLAVIESSQVADLFRATATSERREDVVAGIGGTLRIDDQLSNFVSDRVWRRLRMVLQPLGDELQAAIPFENAIAGLGSEHVVLLEADCGRVAFARARERLRQRHEVERDVLFGPRSLMWSENIDPDRFEALVRDLLECQEGVLWVRRAGPTQEGDAGRDLVCERVVTASPSKEEEPPAGRERMLVQCKVRKRTVGKADVQDIRDALLLHRSSAYLLVVSSKVSGTLMRMLEAIRQLPECDADWWSRDELDALLVKAPEVLARYPDVVQESVG